MGYCGFCAFGDCGFCAFRESGFCAFRDCGFCAFCDCGFCSLWAVLDQKRGEKRGLAFRWETKEADAKIMLPPHLLAEEVLRQDHNLEKLYAPPAALPLEPLASATATS